MLCSPCCLSPALLAFAASLFAQTTPLFTLIDDLVTANRILANEGVLDGYGHVSVRNPANPQHYFLARAGAPGLVTAADIVEYDLDSQPVAAGSATAAPAASFKLPFNTTRLIFTTFVKSNPWKALCATLYKL